jgi:hypothetical protein
MNNHNTNLKSTQMSFLNNSSCPKCSYTEGHGKIKECVDCVKKLILCADCSYDDDGGIYKKCKNCYKKEESEDELSFDTNSSNEFLDEIEFDEGKLSLKKEGTQIQLK